MTTFLSSRTDGGPLSAAWRPAAAMYLATCLVALAVGLWPEAIRPPDYTHTLTPSPALRALAVGQVVFVMLIYPLVLWGRWPKAEPRRYWLRAAVESATLLAATAPVYLAAGYFSDATVGDVLRTAVMVATLFPAAWVAGLLLAKGSVRPVVLIVLLAAAVGGPAIMYIGRELLREIAFDAAAVSPTILAWRTAAERQDLIWPRPIWATLFWPALAAAALLLRILLGGTPNAGEHSA